MGNHNIFNKGKNKNPPSSLTQTEAAASQQASCFITPLSRFTATKALLESSCSPPESISIAYWLPAFLQSLVLRFQHAFPALSPTSLLEECCASATPSLQWTSTHLCALLHVMTSGMPSSLPNLYLARDWALPPFQDSDTTSFSSFSCSP